MANMRGWLQLSVVALAVSFAATSIIAAEERMDLSGQWQVRLDPDGQCSPETLASDNAKFQAVALPGALRDSDLGDPVGPDTDWIGTVRRGLWEQPKYAPYHRVDQFKVPFWLQPNRHYVGAAWYRRKVTIPDSWRAQRILLTLERPHWRTRVWVDGQEAGEGGVPVYTSCRRLDELAHAWRPYNPGSHSQRNGRCRRRTEFSQRK